MDPLSLIPSISAILKLTGSVWTLSSQWSDAAKILESLRREIEQYGDLLKRTNIQLERHRSHLPLDVFDSTKTMRDDMAKLASDLNEKLWAFYRAERDQAKKDRLGAEYKALAGSLDHVRPGRERRLMAFLKRDEIQLYRTQITHAINLLNAHLNLITIAAVFRERPLSAEKLRDTDDLIWRQQNSKDVAENQERKVDGVVSVRDWLPYLPDPRRSPSPVRQALNYLMSPRQSSSSSMDDLYQTPETPAPVRLQRSECHQPLPRATSIRQIRPTVPQSGQQAPQVSGLRAPNPAQVLPYPAAPVFPRRGQEQASNAGYHPPSRVYYQIGGHQQPSPAYLAAQRNADGARVELLRDVNSQIAAENARRLKEQQEDHQRSFKQLEKRLKQVEEAHQRPFQERQEGFVRHPRQHYDDHNRVVERQIRDEYHRPRSRFPDTPSKVSARSPQSQAKSTRNISHSTGTVRARASVSSISQGSSSYTQSTRQSDSRDYQQKCAKYKRQLRDIEERYDTLERDYEDLLQKSNGFRNFKENLKQVALFCGTFSCFGNVKGNSRSGDDAYDDYESHDNDSQEDEYEAKYNNSLRGNSRRRYRRMRSRSRRVYYCE